MVPLSRPRISSCFLPRSGLRRWLRLRSSHLPLPASQPSLTILFVGLLMATSKFEILNLGSLSGCLHRARVLSQTFSTWINPWHPYTPRLTSMLGSSLSGQANNRLMVGLSPNPCSNHGSIVHFRVLNKIPKPHITCSTLSTFSATHTYDVISGEFWGLVLIWIGVLPVLISWLKKS